MKKGFFSYDGPVFELITKWLDLIKLNFLIIFFSLPIITLGTAITAAHYTSIKMRRKEGYVTENFIKSFRENFKQSTILWIFILLGVILVYITQFTLSKMDKGSALIMQGIVWMSVVFAVLILMWVFPIQSRFVNRIVTTIRYAFLFSMKYIFKTLYMLMVHLLPILLLIASKETISIVILFGISAPIYLSSGVYDKLFERLEEETLERQGHKEVH